MSEKTGAKTAEIIPFPVRKARPAAAARSAETKISTAGSQLLAAAEGAWYHGEAVAEANAKR
jgi:hypothetical protein